MGMRTTLRWQQYVEESCERVFDAEFIELDFNEDNNFARARLRMTPAADGLPSERFVLGTPLELKR